jgi:hypothetical protein
MKKSYGLQSIDQKLTSLLKPIFAGSKKEFIVINNLVKNWSEIIGEKYAKLCYAKSVTFDKTQKSAKLTIAVHNAAVGFFLENSSEIILERIATFYGYKAITKIIIKQEPKMISSGEVPEIKLPQAQENFLEERILGIEDKELAETLKKLGRTIFQK